MIIAQGAEAVLKREGNTLIKERISKSYRISYIDNELRKTRTKKEAKSLIKAATLVNTPTVLDVNEETMSITMDFIDGRPLRDCINELNKQELFNRIGIDIKKLHDANLIHGDLTTSNIIIKENNPFYIDFGLAFNSHKLEDKAVDLHLLRQALESKHHDIWEECFDSFMEGYNPDEAFLERFEKVEGRGRYKHKQKS